MIEKGKAIIPIEDYQKLIACHKVVNDGKVMRIYGYWGNHSHEIAILTMPEAMEEMVEINRKLGQNFFGLESKNRELEDKIQEMTKEISDLKTEIEKKKTFSFKRWLTG